MKHNKSLFQDPQINFPANDPSLSFADYITDCQQLISLYHPFANKTTIDANSPFELRPQSQTDTGALLIHGLFDSPMMMQDIGKKLQADGCLVRSVLLPGHGITPGCLLNVRCQDWLDTVSYAISSLAKEVKRIYLVGYSTGAILALYHALKQPKQFAGIVLLSPAFKIKSIFTCASNLHRTISWLLPRAAWLTIQNENDYAKYQSLCFNAINQVYQLDLTIKKLSKTHKLECPMLMIMSANDRTVSSSAALQYFEQQVNPSNRFLWYSTQATAPLTDTRILLRNPANPALRIDDMSHIAIPISPENSHYGIHGDHKTASHVTQNTYRFGSFNKFDLKLLAGLYRCRLTTKQYQRLTFNPDFDYMLKKMRDFMEAY